jgi:hypothetical protein
MTEENMMEVYRSVYMVNLENPECWCYSPDLSGVSCKVAKLGSSADVSQCVVKSGSDSESNTPSTDAGEESLATIVECVICGQTPCDWLTFGEK